MTTMMLARQRERQPHSEVRLMELTTVIIANGLLTILERSSCVCQGCNLHTQTKDDVL